MKVGTDAMVFGALVNPENSASILDIGAGTGVLSLMLAQRNQQAQITAIEVDESSFEDCQVNFKNSPWNNRLEVINGDFLSQQFDKRFDFIISNPPFYQNSLHNADLKLAKARHSDFLPMKQLMAKVASLLSSNGVFSLIFPFQNCDEIKELAKQVGFSILREITVNGKPETPVRTILELSLENRHEAVIQDLTIRDIDGAYSEEYRELTIDFHGKRL